MPRHLRRGRGGRHARRLRVGRRAATPSWARDACPSVYAAPCVPAFDGDNGGATGPGVTAETIRVVCYVPEQSADLTSAPRRHRAPTTRPSSRPRRCRTTSSIYASLGRDLRPRDRARRLPGHRRGRRRRGGPRPTPPQIAAELEPFAVHRRARARPGHVRPGARRRRHRLPRLRRRAARRHGARHGALRVGRRCRRPTSSSADARRLGRAAWPRPTADEATRPPSSPASDLQGQPREGRRDPLRPGPADLRARPRTTGRSTASTLIETYVLDLRHHAAKATELIAKYKSEDITTIVFLGDPFMPGYLTAAATEQDYYPEWVFTGTALTDTNILARGWDPTQMAHAFGISQLAAPTDHGPAGADPALPLVLRRRHDARRRAEPVRAARARGPASWSRHPHGRARPDRRDVRPGPVPHPAGRGRPDDPAGQLRQLGLLRRAPTTRASTTPSEIWWDPTVEAEDESGNDGHGRVAPGARRASASSTRRTRPRPTRSATRTTRSRCSTSCPDEDTRARLPAAARLARGRRTDASGTTESASTVAAPVEHGVRLAGRRAARSGA